MRYHTVEGPKRQNFRILLFFKYSCSPDTSFSARGNPDFTYTTTISSTSCQNLTSINQDLTLNLKQSYTQSLIHNLPRTLSHFVILCLTLSYIVPLCLALSHIFHALSHTYIHTYSSQTVTYLCRTSRSFPSLPFPFLAAMAVNGQGLSVDSSLHSVTISSLQDKLELAAEGANWEYAIFWQPDCPAGNPAVHLAGSLSWAGGCFNGPPATGREALVPSLELIREREARRRMLQELREDILSGNADAQKIDIARSKLSASQWFYLMTTSFTFPANSGMPGQVFAQQEEVWLRNAGQCDTGKFTRAEMAKAAGIQTLLFLPVNGGVLELGNTVDVEEDPSLTQFLRNAFDERAIRIMEGAASAIVRLATSDQTPRSPTPSPPSPPSPKQQVRESFHRVSTRNNTRSPSPPSSPHDYDPGFSSAYKALDSRQPPQAIVGPSPSSLSPSPLSTSPLSPSPLSPSPLSPSPLLPPSLFHIPLGSHPSDYITMGSGLPSLSVDRDLFINPGTFLLHSIETNKDNFQPPKEFAGHSLNSANPLRNIFHRGGKKLHGLSFSGTVFDAERLENERERLESERERLESDGERFGSETGRWGSEREMVESEREMVESEGERFGSETEGLGSERERLGNERERLGSERKKLAIPHSSIDLNQTEVMETQQMDIERYWSTEPGVQMGNSINDIFEGNQQGNSSTLSPFGINVSEGLLSVLQPHSGSLDLWCV